MQSSDVSEEEMVFTFDSHAVVLEDPVPEPEAAEVVEEEEEEPEVEVEEPEVEPEVEVEEPEVEPEVEEPEVEVEAEVEEEPEAEAEEPEVEAEVEPEVEAEVEEEPEAEVEAEVEEKPEVEVEEPAEEPEAEAEPEAEPEVEAEPTPAPEPMVVETIDVEVAPISEPAVEEPAPAPAPVYVEEDSLEEITFTFGSMNPDSLSFTPIDTAHIPDIPIIFHPENNQAEAEPEPEVAPKPVAPVPKVVFLVPYRDRQEHQEFFDNQMRNAILAHHPQGYYEIFYIHQNDQRSFNRGAMKNIGFIMVRRKYPQDYQNITLVFNDVDTTPNAPGVIPSYETTPGVIRHFTGFTHALGGIFSIMGGDFEKLNGFPNYWSWGYEDNMLNKRAVKQGIIVNRETFYSINDTQNIRQHGCGSSLRTVNQGEFDRYMRSVDEGIDSIRNLYYIINEETGFVDVQQFETIYPFDAQLDRLFDTTKSNTPFHVGYSARRGSRINMVL